MLWLRSTGDQAANKNRVSDMPQAQDKGASPAHCFSSILLLFLGPNPRPHIPPPGSLLGSIWQIQAHVLGRFACCMVEAREVAALVGSAPRRSLAVASLPDFGALVSSQASERAVDLCPPPKTAPPRPSSLQYCPPRPSCFLSINHTASTRSRAYQCLLPSNMTWLR